MERPGFVLAVYKLEYHRYWKLPQQLPKFTSFEDFRQSSFFVSLRPNVLTVKIDGKDFGLMPVFQTDDEFGRNPAADSCELLTRQEMIDNHDWTDGEETDEEEQTPGPQPKKAEE